MSFGYTGKILRVDLTTRALDVETREDEFYRTYLGGRGMVAYYLLNELPRGVDPLGDQNILVFAAGPLTGAPVSGQGRNGVGAKSPLTGGFGNAEGGGYWGAELKRAGYDGIVITGKADRPVYLWIHDGAAEIRDAGSLWGKTTGETEDALRAALHDPAIRTALIGPAGENRVHFAAVVNDRFHCAGRTGMGAVMGSKNLKGIAVRATPGQNRMALANPAGVQVVSKWMGAHLDLVSGLHDHGTARLVGLLHKAGGLPTYNFREGCFQNYSAIDGETMSRSILVERGTCFACAVRCKRIVRVAESAYGPVDPEYGGPEYESLGALGANEGIDDLIALAKANEWCAAHGLDTISLGVSIAFAMECAEQGILNAKEMDGIDLRFGNAGAMLEMVRRITFRQGFGNILADGAAQAARVIGRGSEKYAMHVHGQEIPLHEPRLKQGLGVGYAVSPTGADHNHNMHDTLYVKEGEGVRKLREIDAAIQPVPATDLTANKVRILVANTNRMHFMDSALMCLFLPYSPQQMADLMNAVTGWDLQVRGYNRIGERAATMARLFNLREGWDPADDKLPARFFEPFTQGPLAGVPLPADAFALATREYYRQMRWDPQGRPTLECLSDLGIPSGDG